MCRVKWVDERQRRGKEKNTKGDIYTVCTFSYLVCVGRERERENKERGRGEREKETDFALVCVSV